MSVAKRFFKNGILLTLTSLLLQIVGIVYNAYISNEIGADGMGLFTLIMSIYGFSVTLAASGINLAATNMCATALGDNARLKCVLKKCLLYSLASGTFAGVLLYFSSETVSVKWLGDARCITALKLLSVSLPFIALSNALRGYFTAVRRISRNVAAMLFEQTVRICIVIFLLKCMLPDGIEYACIAIVGGGSASEILSFLLSFILFLFDKRRYKSKSRFNNEKALTRELFSITLPIAGASVARSGFSTLEHILLPKGLSKNVLTASTALATYGVVCGMSLPIVLFPTAFIYSFTALLIPEFAEDGSKQNDIHIRYMIKRAVSTTLLFSIMCAAFMLLFSNELGVLIYSNAESGKYIFILAPLVPVMYLDHTVDSMLKGLGEQLYTMAVNILDAALSALIIYPLAVKFGVYGYVIMVYFTEIFNASLSIARLVKKYPVKVKIFDWLVKPLVTAVISAVFTGLLVSNFPLNWFKLIFGGVLFCAVYLGLNFSVVEKSPHFAKV